MCKWGDTKILKIDGVGRDIDSCIYDFTKMLNNNGYQTMASCCGHNKRPASIAFKNKHGEIRELFIMTFDDARKADKLFDPINL